MSQAHFWSLAGESCSAAQLSGMADRPYLGHEKLEFQLSFQIQMFKILFFTSWETALINEQICLSEQSICLSAEAAPPFTKRHAGGEQSRTLQLAGKQRPASPASVQLLLLRGFYIKQLLVTMNRRQAQDMLLLWLISLPFILEK